MSYETEVETIFIFGKYYHKDSITKDGQIYLENYRMIAKQIKNLQEQVNIMGVAQAAFVKELQEEVKNFKEVESPDL